MGGTEMTRWVRTAVDMLDHDILNVGPYDRRSAWLWPFSWRSMTRI